MTIPRVVYQERQRLRDADLNDEQAYRLDQRRRHNVAQHGWGIVHGLQLVKKSQKLWVKPGMGVDGYGREIVVPEELVLSTDDLDHACQVIFGPGNSGDLGLWLLYGREPADTRTDSEDQDHDRWREQCRLRLTAAPEFGGPSPSEPPPGAHDFEAHQPAPDDREVEWPVYLGAVGPGADPDLSGRRQVALVGDVVRDPADRVRMSLAKSPGGEPRFAADLRDSSGKLVERLVMAPEKDRDSKIDAGFQVHLQGNARVKQHDVHLGAEADSGAAIDLAKAVTLPTVAAPWRIYRTTVTDSGATRGQLRVELGHPGGERELSESRLVVGYYDDTFVPCLTVAADGRVTVHGDLGIVTGGELIRAPIAASPDDEAFVDAMTQTWVDGVEKTVGQVGDGAQPTTESLNVQILDFTVTGPDPDPATGLYAYGISLKTTVQNTGNTSLSSIEVTATANGQPATCEPSSISLLQPGATSAILIKHTGKFDMPASAWWVVFRLQAQGEGASGVLVSDSDSQVVPVLVNE